MAAKYKTKNGRIVLASELEESKEGEFLPKAKMGDDLYSMIDAACILQNIGDIDEAYSEIDDLLEKAATGKLDENINIRIMLGRLRTLDRKLNLQFRLLSKALPDLKSVEHTGNITASNLDEIPDSVLEEIVTGRINKKRLAQLEKMFGIDGSEIKH
jgi:hypothetical protein